MPAEKYISGNMAATTPEALRTSKHPGLGSKGGEYVFKNNFSSDSGNSGELVAVEGATMQGNVVTMMHDDVSEFTNILF